VPIFVPFLLSRFAGSGGASFGSVGSGSILLAAVIGFVIAAAWEWHRLAL
jgi:hypothetical protein